MIIDQRMEPLGEVELLMNLAADNTRGSILKDLLSAYKMQASQGMDLDSRIRGQEQMLLQVQVAEPIVPQILPNNENFVQHIPITYLAAVHPSMAAISSGNFVQPMAYVLAENGYCAMGQNDPQKIILLREVDTTASQPVYAGSETKVCATEESREQEEVKCEDSGCWVVKQEGVDESCGASEPMEEEEEISISDLESNGVEELPQRMEMKDSDEEYDKLTDEDNVTEPQEKVSYEKEPVTKNKSKLKSQWKSSKKASIKEVKKDKRRKMNAEYKKEKQNLFELTKLEDNVRQVAERLKFGCECADSNCFDGLCPDDVFRHRLNIADLTKQEHDMYLMGVIMASIHNLEETCRHKERLRIRCCYAYQGKKVCLTAFLYLQHVTLYQMKKLRSHLKRHGVSPRIHGNRGRKPANFSFDIYRSATEFVQSYIERKCINMTPNLTFPPNSSDVEDQKKVTVKIVNQMTSYHLPPDCTRRCIHQEYKIFCKNLKLRQKAMKYSTFTNFLKKQFPNIKFQKWNDKNSTVEQSSVGRTEEKEEVRVKKESDLLPKGLKVGRVKEHSDEGAVRRGRRRRSKEDRRIVHL